MRLLKYIHIGPLELGTFGILMAMASIAAYFVLRADLQRRKLPDIADTIVLVTVLAGIVGAKLYHVLESPVELMSDPAGQIFNRGGFAWAGGLIAGIVSLVIVARRNKIAVATMFDIASPAAALGYAIGRIGCLISGDGDYGVPTNLPWGMSFPNGLVPTSQRVHPTPIYEFLAGAVIFYYLWRLGAHSLWQRRPAGEVLGAYFIYTGLVRFLVEFIRINPGWLPAPQWLQGFVDSNLRIAQNLGINSQNLGIYNPRFTGFSNAQVIAALSMIAGAVILVHSKHKFRG